MKKLNTKKTTWDYSRILPSTDKKTLEKEKSDIARGTDRFVKKWKERNDYTKDAAVLKEALDDYEKWFRKYAGRGGYGFYLSLKTATDLSNPELKAQNDQLSEFATKQWNRMRFFGLALAKVTPAQQKKFLNDPRLSSYRSHLRTEFDWASYRLGEQEENILNLLGGPSHRSWVRMTDDFLAREEREALTEKGKTQPLTLAFLLANLQSAQKRVRDSAAVGINGILADNVDVAEAEMNAVLQAKKVRDELKGHSRPDQARHLDDNIDSRVVDTLVDTVASRFDISERYYGFKARVTGRKKLAYHERSMSLGKVEKEYVYQEGVEMIHDVFKRLDPQFADILLTFVNNGHIDVYPKKGKRDGAFCAHNRIIDPTFVMLNWTNMLKDVTTFAHEMGHGVHYELARKKQHALYFGTSLATTEVASTFMEDFVFDRLLKDADDEERFVLMTKKVEQDISTIFRQIAAYRFEQELHATFKEKGYLSKEEIGKMFQGHMAAYMGKYVEQSPGSENWWTYWSHFRVFFYVYSYASGLLISKALQRRVRENPAAIEDVKTFMAAGVSDSPEDIFKNIGIDISKKTFWKEGLSEVEALLNETERLGKKLKKI